MKLRIVLLLETMEQVGVILTVARELNVNVDVTPVAAPIVHKRKKGKRGKRSSTHRMTRTSKPSTLLVRTDIEPQARLDLYQKLSAKIPQQITRRDLAWQLAKALNQDSTKQTSSVVTKWIDQGAFKPA